MLTQIAQNVVIHVPVLYILLFLGRTLHCVLSLICGIFSCQ